MQFTLSNRRKNPTSIYMRCNYIAFQKLDDTKNNNNNNKQHFVNNKKATFFRAEK